MTKETKGNFKIMPALAPAKEASAILSAHTGAVRIERSELVHIKTPPRELSFTPVPHWELLDSVERSFGDNRIEVVKTDCAVMKDGLVLYAVMLLSTQKKDFQFALGIKTANDKTMKITFTAGVRVFVCDNGCFSGDSIIWDRKHSGLLTMGEVGPVVLKAIGKYGSLAERLKALKGEVITENDGKAMILDAYQQDIIPQKLITPVYQAWVEPPHQDFKRRTMWSLHNAFTEVFKALPSNQAMDRAVQLGNMFQI